MITPLSYVDRSGTTCREYQLRVTKSGRAKSTEGVECPEGMIRGSLSGKGPEGDIGDYLCENKLDDELCRSHMSRGQHTATKFEETAITEPSPKRMFFVPRHPIPDLNGKLAVEWSDLYKLDARMRPHLGSCSDVCKPHPEVAPLLLQQQLLHTANSARTFHSRLELATLRSLGRRFARCSMLRRQVPGASR